MVQGLNINIYILCSCLKLNQHLWLLAFLSGLSILTHGVISFPDVTSDVSMTN